MPSHSLAASAAAAADAPARTQRQLSSLRELLGLSLLMTDGRDTAEIMALAVSAAPAFGHCRVLTAHQPPAAGEQPNGTADAALLAQLSALGGEGGPVTVAGPGWAWAYPLRAFGGNQGYLAVAADEPPSADERFLLTALGQCTGAALGQAALRRAIAAQATRLEAVTEDLSQANAELRHHAAAHDALVRASAGHQAEDRVQAVTDALHELTGLPVVVEDRFGAARAWAGTTGPPSARPGRRRAELLRTAQRLVAPVRDRDRLVAVCQTRDQVLGTIAVLDPDRGATDRDRFALEHAALVLAGELAHLRALAEVELRLRRDLVEDLLSGTDERSAYARAESIGHDLRRPHHVLAISYPDRPIDEQLTRAVEQATHQLGRPSLFTRRADQLVLLAQRSDDSSPGAQWAALHAELHRHLPGAGTGVAIGVGRRCETCDRIPQSWHDAQRALAIRLTGRAPDGLTSYDELGIYRVLGTGSEQAEIELYVQEWLGSLLAYDAGNHTGLTRTLAVYLDCGGSYDETAAALIIHRSTLRYRLQRIREISRLELSDVDTRLNLHVATRAWTIRSGAHTPSPGPG